MKLIGFIVVGSFIAGCSGWNSDLDTQFVPDPDFNAKPKCLFKIKDNCWTRSLQLIASCAPDLGQTEGILTEDLRFCSHDNGDFVEFINPSQIVQPEISGDIEFNVYSKNKRCFHLKRRGGEIHIDQNPFGEISSVVLANGDTQVSCLFGESYTVPALVKERGCQNQKANIAEFTPGMELANGSGDTAVAVNVNILGTGMDPMKLLSCRR